MIKKLFALFLALFAAAAFAAVDANKATPAELDSVKGIGPAIAGKIVDERKKAPFKDWQDMIDRVKGVGENNAAKFSAEGLTVNGGTFKGVAAAPTATKADTKAAAPMATPATPAMKADHQSRPATAAAAKPAETSAADKKAAAAKDKADKKAAADKEKADKAAAKAAEKDAAKQAKADKAAAKKADKKAEKDAKAGVAPATAAASAAKK